jgi:hypothetical protein
MKTWDETKEERRERKTREKAGLLSTSESTIVLQPANTNNKNYVVCLKWGNKYSAEYVNKLYNMVKRNLTIDYEFVCFTEDRKGIDPNIRIEKLPTLPVSGWWYKPWFLSNELPITGTLLFLDLDVVVFKNIDYLFTYKPEKNFCIIRDFNRHVRKQWDRMNSSVFRTHIGSQQQIYEHFKLSTPNTIRKFQGDQDFMYKYIKDFVFWPDEWIQSYKWEMRNKTDLGIVNGKRNFIKLGFPTIKPETSIAVFHGDPNPSVCQDTWVVDNWK